MSKRNNSVILILILLLFTCSCVTTAGWYKDYGITKEELQAKNPEIIPRLAQALENESGYVRIEALNQLGKMGIDARAALPELKRLLVKENNAKVKMHVIQTFGKVAVNTDDSVVSGLIAFMGDGNPHVRKKAMMALDTMNCNDPRFIDILLTVSRNDRHPALRQIAGDIYSKAKVRVALNKDLQRSNTSNKEERQKPETKTFSFNFPKSETTNRYAIAVIIGNKDYSLVNKDVPDVKYAHNDAKAMYEYITTTLGYRKGNIIFLENATQADLISTFGAKGNPQGKLYDWIRPGKSDVFIYYSGHGAPSLNTGKGYLLPINGDPTKVELNGYSLETLYENLAELPSKKQTVLIDACFSGSSAEGSVVRNASSITLRYADFKEIPNTTILTASAISEIASWDENAQLGLFTHYFLKGVSGEADKPGFGNGDGIVNLSEIKSYLSDEVVYQARRRYGRKQHPQIFGGEDVLFSQLQ